MGTVMKHEEVIKICMRIALLDLMKSGITDKDSLIEIMKTERFERLTNEVYKDLFK